MVNSVKDNLQTNKQTERNVTLDVYKGVLITLVVLRHVLQYSVSDEGGILTNYIWAVQMPGFMLVSGYFSGRQVNNMRALGKRIVLSAQHYALPFFSWHILINCLLLGKFDRNPGRALLSILAHVDGGLWFLWVIFILSIITTMANVTMSFENCRVIKTAFVLLICFGLIGTAGFFYGINFFGIKFILYYAIFYGFGWLLKWTEAWWKQWWPKISNISVTIALVIFLAVVFNYDLYNSPDNLKGITLRCIAGFTGNLVLLKVCRKYEDVLDHRLKLGWIGLYTLEIYASHMPVNNLMQKGDPFFTLSGFGNFLASLTLTVLFTIIIIIFFKSIPAADYIFFGKKQKRTN